MPWSPGCSLDWGCRVGGRDVGRREWLTRLKGWCDGFDLVGYVGIGLGGLDVGRRVRMAVGHDAGKDWGTAVGGCDVGWSK